MKTPEVRDRSELRYLRNKIIALIAAIAVLLIIGSCSIALAYGVQFVCNDLTINLETPLIGA